MNSRNLPIQSPLNLNRRLRGKGTCRLCHHEGKIPSTNSTVNILLLFFNEVTTLTLTICYYYFLDNNSTPGVANVTKTSILPPRQQQADTEQINIMNPIFLRPAPPPPELRASDTINELTNRDTVRFEFIRDDNELLINVDDSEEATEEFNFANLHEIIGRPVIREIEEKKSSKAMQDQPLIMF